MLNQLDLARVVVMRVLYDQAAAHRREPYTVEGLLTSLERAELTGFAAEAR